MAVERFLTSPPASNASRYSRQERFAPLGETGQRRLASARVLICGCGALGSVLAERLARAGVGSIRIVDRDWVELSNLQRQSLFTEADAQETRPKSVAAADAIRRINSAIEVEAHVDDMSFENIAQLAAGCDLLLDGTDNFETRFLINDYCVQAQVPWVHGGCLGASGQVLTIQPGQTACFRCLVPDLPPSEALQTCDTAGVLGPAVALIASFQAAEALKILSGNAAVACPGLIVLDSWNTECRIIGLPRNKDCPACGRREFPFLSGAIRSELSVLCGKNAIQIHPPSLRTQSLPGIANKLRPLGQVKETPFFVRLDLPPYAITIFQGGRTIVEGTTQVAQAKSVLARTLGS